MVLRAVGFIQVEYRELKGFFTLSLSFHITKLSYFPLHLNFSIHTIIWTTAKVRRSLRHRLDFILALSSLRSWLMSQAPRYSHNTSTWIRVFSPFSSFFQSAKIILPLNWVHKNTEGRTTGGPKNEQFRYGGLSAQPVLTYDVNASILSLRDMQAFYTHCIFVDSHICTKRNLTHERPTPVGCNAAVDKCHKPFSSPLNAQGAPAGTELMLCAVSDTAILPTNGTMKQTSNPSMNTGSEPKYTATNATSIELCGPWMKGYKYCGVYHCSCWILFYNSSFNT